MREALRGLGRYPLRTALSLLGLGAGVGAVVTTLALLDAAHRQGMTALERTGALDVVRLSSPAEVIRDGFRTRLVRRARLGPAEAARLRDGIPWVRGAMLASAAELPVRGPAASLSVTVRGVSADAARFLPLRVLAGRFLSPAEETGGARAVVLSRSLAEDLLGSARNASGREVIVAGQRFEVVGVLATAGDEPTGEPAVAMVPFRAATERLGVSPLDVVLHLAAGSRSRVGELEDAVRAMLPKLQPGVDAAAFELESSREAIDALETSARTQTAILGGVAALALLVAGSGILNTLLVGVKERTREIGTRRALGARRRTILAQFLLEAALLALPGAALGLGAGVALTRALAPLLERSSGRALLVEIEVGPGGTLAAVLLSVLVALGAGLWPAWKASAVEPAEALRYE